MARQLRVRGFVLGAACVSVAAFASAARAHDPLARAAILELQRTYRSQAICERVNLQVRVPAPGPAALPRVSRAAVVLRMDLDPRGLDDAPVVGVDLGTMVIAASNGRIIITHPRDGTLYYESGYAGPLSTRAIAQVVQPVPIPQLDLAAAAAGTEPCSEFWPYARNIRWGPIEIDGRSPSRKTIHGTCEGGTVSLGLSSGRLRSLTIERSDPRTVMLFTFLATGPCEPQRMIVDTTGRRRVSSLPDLKPGGALIRLGARAPRMPLSPPAGGDWSIADVLEPPPEAVIVGMPAADHAVLVMTKATADLGVIPGLPRLDLGRLADLLRQMRSTSFQPRPPGRLGEAEDLMARFGFARVMVMKDAAPDQVLEQMRAAQGKWQEHMLWTTEPGSTIDVFAPGADAAVVILDREEVLRAVWPIDPNLTAEQVADQVQAALFELAPTETKRP